MITDNIVIIEKPQNISYERIQKLIHNAHSSNMVKGLVYGTANQSVEQLKKTLEKDAICFVGMDGDKLVATGTVEFRKRSLLFMNFEIACFGLFGVSPEYKGRNLGNRILDKRIEIASAKGYKYMYCSTAEENTIVRHMYEKRGFVKVDYYKAPANNFYSIRYLKWEHNSKLLDFVVCLTYKVRRYYVRRAFKL